MDLHYSMMDRPLHRSRNYPSTIAGDRRYGNKKTSLPMIPRWAGMADLRAKQSFRVYMCGMHN